MPKETFFNLPPDKREMVFQAAVEEFAAHPYPQASVNRIVGRAGIAKGSFYQYFEDKKDLFLYCLSRMGEEKMGYLAPVLKNAPQMPFFDLLRELYLRGLRFAVEHPPYMEIGRRLLATRGTPIYEEVKAYSQQQGQRFFADLLRRAIERGDVRPDADVSLLAYLIAGLNTLLTEYYVEHVTDGHEERMQQTVEQFLDLLRFGIGAS